MSTYKTPNQNKIIMYNNNNKNKKLINHYNSYIVLFTQIKLLRKRIIIVEKNMK